MTKKQQIDAWANAQDWTRTDADIARDAGLNVSSVRYARRTRNKGKRPSLWANVDWSLSTDDIASERRVTPSCVEYYRKKMAPWTSRKGKKK